MMFVVSFSKAFFHFEKNANLLSELGYLWSPGGFPIEADVIVYVIVKSILFPTSVLVKPQKSILAGLEPAIF
jgi:hypothetical protein